jgi:uncharacterized membrane protein
MKMLDGKRISRVCAVVFIVMILVSVAAVSAEAKIKVTVNNKTSQKIFIAFGYDLLDPYETKGWFGVEAGKSRVITVDTASSLTQFKLAWHAKSANNKLVWKGERKEWVHPTKPFEYEYFPGERPDEDGAVQVGFRIAKIKDSDDRENGTATINLTAK